MERLPGELVDAILQHCVAHGPKNTVLELRLVCRAFNRTLKPFVCKTVNLELSRLSKASGREQPQMDALQTVGYHCKGLFIDLMVLRDELEVDFLHTVFKRVMSMTEFCRTLETRYCMNDESFTETQYYQTVESMLFYCRDVDRLRLNLPFQLVGKHCNAATMILANTFKAFASRPEEDSAYLKTLVLENVPDIAVCNLWMNPIDVMNIMNVLAQVENLVITMRRHETQGPRASLFGSCLWSMVENAEKLRSLCLIGMDHDDRPPRGLKQTKFWQVPVDEWRVRSLPAPLIILEHLTCLELKRVEIAPEAFLKVAETFGSTLEELYLNEIYLKVEQSLEWNEDSKKVLWVGLPNQRPAEDCYWIAMELRWTLSKLRICRASFLAYDNYLLENIEEQHPEFDLVDPCGLGRSVSQRFVEVVMGVRQPNMPSGEPVEFIPPSYAMDSLLGQMKPRPRALQVTEYDTNAHQTAVGNTTSHWHRSIDGVFPNCNHDTLDKLHYIAETACKGMNEMRRRTTTEWPPGDEVVTVGQPDVMDTMEAPGLDET